MNDTEPSSKRAEANRRNAQKSTGPRTAAGKERARFNAVKHGMRAKTIVLPGEDPDAFQARMEAWTNDLKPADDVERFLVAPRRAALLAARARRPRPGRPGRRRPLRRRRPRRRPGRRGRRPGPPPLLGPPRTRLLLSPVRDHPRRPPRVSWSGLIDDPDDPVRLLNRLESTAMGCAWLLDRWGELRDVLEAGPEVAGPGSIQGDPAAGPPAAGHGEDARVMAIYLGCSAMEPPEGLTFKDLGNELHWNEQKRFNEWAGQRGVLGRIPADAETGRGGVAGAGGRGRGAGWRSC